MEIKEKYTSEELVIMALENENTNRMVEDHEVDRWWLRNYWRKLTKKEKREWADALLFERVGDSILNECSKNKKGRAISGICRFFDTIR